MRYNTVHTLILTSLGCELSRCFNEKNWRVSLCVQELCHPLDFLWILAATPGCRNTTGLPVVSWFHHYLVLGFWLASVQTTGLSVPSSLQHVYLTQALDGNRSHSDLPFLESHCRLLLLYLVKWTSLRMVWDDCSRVLKVSFRLKDENWRKNSMTSLEPRSVRTSPFYIVFESRFIWDVVLDRWSTHKNIRFHHKAFRAIILLACSRGLS